MTATNNDQVGPPFSSVLAELVDIDFPFVILTGAFRSFLQFFVFMQKISKTKLKLQLE